MAATKIVSVNVGDRPLDLANILKWIEKRLGIGWFTARANLDHPIARAWLIANASALPEADVQSNNFPRVMAFADTLMRLEGIEMRLRDGSVDTSAGFRDSLLSRATTSISDFDAAETEAIVAYGHSTWFGMPVIAIEPTNDKSPDFEISLDGRPILLECKARTTEPPIHRHVVLARELLGKRLQPLIESVVANYCVSVEIDHVPSAADADALVEFLRANLLTGQQFSGEAGGFRVRAIIPLAKDEEVISTELQPLGAAEHVPEPVRSFILDSGVATGSTYAYVFYGAASHRDEKPMLFYSRNPRALVLHIAVTPDHTKATARQIGAARPQLSPATPGIVAIRAPDFYGIAQFAQLFERLRLELRRTARVSGVELWHHALTASWPQPGHLRWDTRWQLKWVGNLRARLPLSPSFLTDPRHERQIEVFRTDGEADGRKA